jgi:hypothetical protein
LEGGVFSGGYAAAKYLFSLTAAPSVRLERSGVEEPLLLRHCDPLHARPCAAPSFRLERSGVEEPLLPRHCDPPPRARLCCAVIKGSSTRALVPRALGRNDGVVNLEGGI